MHTHDLGLRQDPVVRGPPLQVLGAHDRAVRHRPAPQRARGTQRLVRVGVPAARAELRGDVLEHACAHGGLDAVRADEDVALRARAVLEAQLDGPPRRLREVDEALRRVRAAVWGEAREEHALEVRAVEGDQASWDSKVNLCSGGPSAGRRTGCDEFLECDPAVGLVALAQVECDLCRDARVSAVVRGVGAG